MLLCYCEILTSSSYITLFEVFGAFMIDFITFKAQPNYNRKNAKPDLLFCFSKKRMHTKIKQTL